MSRRWCCPASGSSPDRRAERRRSRSWWACCSLLVAAWLLWELWTAVKPRPITDEFLKLLHDSFGHDWRNPLTWPWARLSWAYGFTLLGAASMAGAGLVVWTLASSSGAVKAPAAHVGTSQSFRLDSASAFS